MKLLRGNIVLVNLEPVIGSEQGKTRPAVVIQNNIGNEYSPTTIVASITSKIFGKEYLHNVKTTARESGLKSDSAIQLNQIRTVDKRRIIKKLGFLDESIMRKVDWAIKVSLDLQ